MWSSAGAIARERCAQDGRGLDPDAVHGREHVRLRQLDADVDAPDARAPLEVGLVVRAEQELVEPAAQRLLEACDLRLAAR